MIISMIGTFLPILGLQYFIMPQVALRLGASEYGQMITTFALINLFSSTFGITLNNSRLIHYKKYESKKITGDFNIILLFFIILNLSLMIVSLIYFNEDLSVGWVGSLLIIVSSTLSLIKTYARAEFRVTLNYYNMLMYKIVLLIGYLIGFIFFIYTLQWIYIYLLGFGLSLLFLISKTVILKEPLKRTTEFKETLMQSTILAGSGFLGALSTYLDKLLLLPLLGANAVTIYFVATFLGKGISMAIGPITGVILSYLAHYKSVSHKQFKHMILIITSIGILGYLTILLASETILTILYPQFVDEAMQYIPITSITIMVSMVCSFINPIILKFTNASWQFVINGSHMFVYITLAIFLQRNYGLMGFSLALMIAQIFRYVITIAVYLINRKTINNSNNNNIKLVNSNL